MFLTKEAKTFNQTRHGAEETERFSLKLAETMCNLQMKHRSGSRSVKTIVLDKKWTQVIQTIFWSVARDRGAGDSETTFLSRVRHADVFPSELKEDDAGNFKGRFGWRYETHFFLI